MPSELSYESAVNGIMQDLVHMSQVIEESENEALKQMGNVVKKNVVRELKRSNVEEMAKRIQPKNYDGSTPYKHMKDDVKVSVKSKHGKKYVVISGGKLTGYKWRFLDDGTVYKGRVHTRATHFIENSMNESNGAIDQILHNLEGRVTNDR